MKKIVKVLFWGFILIISIGLFGEMESNMTQMDFILNKISYLIGVIGLFTPIFVIAIYCGVFKNIKLFSNKGIIFKFIAMIGIWGISITGMMVLDNIVISKYSNEYKEIEAKKDDQKEITEQVVKKEDKEKSKKEIVKKEEKPTDYYKIGMEYLEKGDVPNAANAFRNVTQSNGKYNLAQKQLKDIREAETLRLAQSVDYAYLSKNLSNMKDAAVEISGQIIDIQENNGKTLLVINMNHIYEDIYRDSVVVISDEPIESVNDDYITIYGEIMGDYKSKKKEIANWWNDSYTIYYDANTALQRMPVIRAVLIAE